MAPANSVPSSSSFDALDPAAPAPTGPSRAAVQDSPRPDAPAVSAGDAPVDPATAPHGGRRDQEPLLPEPVSQEELNSWRRGFTPQAEIWNGRLAMLGLSVGLGVLLLARLVAGAGGQ